MHKVQWIYESPDKGDTVYRRRFGSQNSTERGLVIKKPDPHSQFQHISAEIVAESPNDPALKEHARQTTSVLEFTQCKELK